MHVSFKAEEDWKTVTYDAEELPREFESVLLILGERFETANRFGASPDSRTKH